MNKANDFLNGIKGIGKYISDRYYLTLLKDTPTGYQGHSGDYLIVNDNESGIHFTGIEKVAADLTDYGFLDGVGGGSSTGGASDSSNIFGAEIKVNSSNIVTIVSQTSDFIESIEQDTGPGTNANNFTITFKDGIFTETPLLSSTVRNRDGTLVESVSYNPPNPLTEDYENGKLYKIKFEATDPTTKDVNLGNGNWGANLIFIKNGNDFIAGGGGSPGGGFQSNQITKDNFAGDFDLPDAIYVPLIRSGEPTLRPFYFNGFHGTTENAFAYIQYEWNIGKNERFTINFSNNTHGGFASATIHESTTTTFNLSTIPSATTNQPSIKEFIADDRAVYFGGSGGEITTFTGLSDTPSDFTAGKYLRVNDAGNALEYVDITGVSSSSTTFNSLTDTPTGYQSGYYLQSTESGVDYVSVSGLAQDLTDYGFVGESSTIPSYTDLPDVTENDGKIVASGCDLYHSCNGIWNKIGGESIPPPVEAPGCVTNLEEYNQYQEYKDAFLADNLGNTFDKMLNFNEDISDLIYDVCLFSDKELSSVKIDETTYKWGMFAKTQTVNITATPGVVGDRDIEFMGWAGDGAVFGDVNSAQTTLLVDNDLSVTGYFSEIFQTTCEDISLHIQSDTTDTNTIFTDLSSNTYPITVVGDIQHSSTDAYLGNTSITFDGVGDYLTVGNLDDFKFLHDGSSDYTIEFWTKIQETPTSIDLNHPNAGSVGTQLGSIAGSPENMFDGNNSTYYGINNVIRLDRFYMKLATWFTQPITNVDRIDWRYLVDECCGQRRFFIHDVDTNAWVFLGSGPQGSSVQEAIFRKSPTFPPFDAIRVEYHGSSSSNRQFRNYEIRFYQNSSSSDIPTTRINPTTSSATILSTASAYNMHGINIAIKGDQLTSTIYNGTSSPHAGKLYSSTGIETDQWHHVALTYSQGKYNLYLDGVFQQEHLSIANASQSTQSKILKIGSSDSGSISDFFKGNMQDMRIAQKAIYTSNFIPPSSLLNNPC